MLSVYTVDDHPVARLAIKLFLSNDGVHIAGEADDGLQALGFIRTMNPPPDIVVVDLDIPSLSGLELIEKLRNGGYEGGILVLTGRDDAHFLSRCMGVGADGFVSKRNNLEELGDAVRAISRGYGYFPIKRQLGAAAILPTGESEAIQHLSNRELQVLQQLARGMRIIDIAAQMHVSTKTVSTYKARLLVKLGITSTIELIDFARRHGLDA
ncbi:MAG TPA: DNA-binding response regulator [Serratia grimesii]|uniref:DNA-binding response regulator n=1 Tax=Serratia grimesii TaxID=82995 RepID=A0A9C7QTX0_9GAMM|nr:response regulator transcription factor [Serratia grimesii]HCK00053.1 DNA-binding response regulator [Serratia grimesii]